MVEDVEKKWREDSMSRPQERARTYKREIFDKPLLSREEERALFRRYQDDRDEKALTAIVTAHLKLVFTLVQRHCGNPHDQRFEDLMQEGSLGLIEAAQHFDLSRKLRFSTYAQYMVLSRIKGRLLADAHMVRIATSMSRKKAYHWLQREKNRRGILARPLSGSEAHDIALCYGTTEDVIAVLDAFASGSPLPLDAPARSPSGDSLVTFGDFLPSDAPNPEEEAVENDLRARRRALFKEAAERAGIAVSQRNLVIFLRHYLGGETLDAIAADHRLSRERIRQISVRVLSRLVRALLPRAAYGESRQELLKLASLHPDVLGREIRRRMKEYSPAP